MVDVKSIEHIRSGVYQGRIRDSARALGLEPALIGMYRAAVGLLSDDIYSCRVGDASADYHVSTDTDTASVVYNLESERPVLEPFLSGLNSGDVVYDVGASVGLYSCLAASVTQGVSVLSLDPNASEIRGLNRNTALNGVDDQVTAETTALGAESDVITIGDEDIAVRTGDGLVASGEAPPDVMKLDVEGAEYGVIDGFAETLDSGACRSIYIEEHPRLLQQRGHTTDDLRSKLRELGFDVTPIHQREGVGPEEPQQFIEARR